MATGQFLLQRRDPGRLLLHELLQAPHPFQPTDHQRLHRARRALPVVIGNRNRRGFFIDRSSAGMPSSPKIPTNPKTRPRFFNRINPLQGTERLPVRDQGVPGAARRGEVPDRVRSAAPANHVRGQAACGHPGGPDAVAAQPHPPPQGRRLRPRLRERPRRDPRSIRGLLRRLGDGGRGGSRPHVRVKGELDASGIYLGEEVERFCAVYFKPKHGKARGTTRR